MGSAAPLPELLPVEGAAAGAAAGKAGSVWGAGTNTVGRRGRGRHSLGGPVGTSHGALFRVTTQEAPTPN